MSAAYARRRTRADAAAATLPVSARHAALAAGATLTVTGRGDLWTVAIALGVADASLLTALAVAGAGVATLARTGSAAFGDIAGGQAVLGAAGFTGSTAAVAATWASAVSLIAVGRRRLMGAGLGLVAGALVWGPAVSGGAGAASVRIAGLVGGGALGWLAAPEDGSRRWQALVAVGVGALGVALGVVAGYH